MATQEKLMKSLNGLKQLISSNESGDSFLKKKEKIQHCYFIAEAILNPTIKIAKNFNTLLSYSIDIFLQLCDDPDTDVITVADECLNKIIKAMYNGNISKIQIELHKEIRQNRSARSLRAALSRFAILAHHIRPQKGKIYVCSLFPCLSKILERQEESVHETLAKSLPKIILVLGCFTTDNDIKGLLKACLNNIENVSRVIQRATASCILTICLNSKKPYVFLSYVLNILLDYVVPVQGTHTSTKILGVLGCLKTILPHIKATQAKLEPKSNFESKKEVAEKLIAIDRYLQVYELCLHYMAHSDQNIINSALETLNVLLQHASEELINILLSPDGIKKSRIFMYDVFNKKDLRSPSQLSISTTIKSEENLLSDSDLLDSRRSDIEKWVDESKLSIINVNYVKSNNDAIQELQAQDSNIRNLESSNQFDYSNIDIGTIQDTYPDSIKSENVLERLEKLGVSEDSSEKSYSHRFDEKSVGTTDVDMFEFEIDIGDFLDRNTSLLYCARYITRQFLLNGIPKQTVSDKVIRVTIKNLALTCLSTILKIYPEMLLVFLDRNAESDVEGHADITKQKILDIILYAQHSDPQIRGAVRVLLSNFIRAVLVKSCGDYIDWVDNYAFLEDYEKVDLDIFSHIMLEGIKDDWKTCTMTLGCLTSSLNLILQSEICMKFIPVLDYLPNLAKASYWLVKVKLLELITTIHYVNVYYIYQSSIFQDKIIYNVLFELLNDEDQRVRRTAAESIVKIIPLLHFPHQFPDEAPTTCKAIYLKHKQFINLSDFSVDINVNKKHFVKNLPFPYNSTSKPSNITEYSLSLVIIKLYRKLLITTSKFYIFGCIESLTLLSHTYPTTVYQLAWNSFRNSVHQQDKAIFQRSVSINAANPILSDIDISSSSDMLNIVVHLLGNSITVYDLNGHLNLIKLAGNLFAGKWLANLQTVEISKDAPELWEILTDKTLAALSEEFLVHIIRILNIFCHILDDTVPSLPQTKPVLSNLPSASNLSPIKRKKSDAGDKKILSPGKILEKDDKSDKKVDIKINAMGYFANLPHYMKLYDILKVAYNNYKITLDSEASENFLSFLNATLNSLAKILEVATLTETGRIAEEILQYLKQTFMLDATMSVLCVQQLLKSLFSTNITSDVDNLKYLNEHKQKEVISESTSTFYYHISQLPFDDISKCINSFVASSASEYLNDYTLMGYLYRKENKPISKKPDKILADYIRIFEPMVIKSLKHYTTTSDINLQCQVLKLLSQLIQLKVNYCLLDSDQIFLGFVMKQFEYIEEGQISPSSTIIPSIFQFLVHLSYGKNHSKNIIEIPKIIQLCDGLMASGQSPKTHCIPALLPIVEDVFLLRNKSNTQNFKELETTREVLVSILLRLLEYSEIIDLFILILHESKYCGNEMRCVRWSSQLFDALLPLLKQNKLHLNDVTALNSMRKLIFAMDANVFNIDEIIVALFSAPVHPLDPDFTKYLSKMIILLMILTQVKESKLLGKITELHYNFAPQSIDKNYTEISDPLNVTKTFNAFDNLKPEEIYWRLMFRLTLLSTEVCLQNIDGNNDDEKFIVKQFGVFLLYFSYILQTDRYTTLASSVVELVKNSNEDDVYLIHQINSNFLKLRYVFPLLTMQWCSVLVLLNKNDKDFWYTVMQLQEGVEYPAKNCINLDLLKIGSIILFSDYTSANLLNENEEMFAVIQKNIDTIIECCDEIPISELLDTIHRSSITSGLFIQIICKYYNFEAIKTSKILKCVENVNNSQIGTTLMFLVPKLINTTHVTMFRSAAHLACRQIEYLLTLSRKDVLKQLPEENLKWILSYLAQNKLLKKHESLASLFNKLTLQFYTDLEPLPIEHKESIDPANVKTLTVNKEWFVLQTKQRCEQSNNGLEIAELLSKISKEDLRDIINDENFNKMFLRDCIVWCINNQQTDHETYLMDVCLEFVESDLVKWKAYLPSKHEVFLPEAYMPTFNEKKYSKEMKSIFSNFEFRNMLNYLIPSITELIKSFKKCSNIHFQEISYGNIVYVAVTAMESLVNSLGDNKIEYIKGCLECTDFILREQYLCNILILEENMSKTTSMINCLYKLINYLLMNSEPLPALPHSHLFKSLNDEVYRPAGQASYQLSILIRWMEKSDFIDIPKYLLENLKNIIISLARLPMVNSYITTPPSVWDIGLEIDMSGPYSTQVPPLPLEFMLSSDVLEEFIYRVTLLGWTSRQQFEEIWVTLLSVLGANPLENNVTEDANTITYATSLTVQAITTILLQTLYLPQPGNKVASQFIHISRDTSLDANLANLSKLRSLQGRFFCSLEEFNKCLPNFALFSNVFNKGNLEKQHSYSYSQLSMEYLWISSKVVEVINDNLTVMEIYNRRENALKQVGIDINSCLQFLLDLYTQWFKSETIMPLQLLQETVKSILAISDIFTDKSQYSWMLDTCLHLSKTHYIEDEIIHQYLIVAVCKATALLTPEIEVLEYVKKLINQSLKSAFLSIRISALHGLLFILQVCMLGNTVLGGISEEMQFYLPIAIEYIQFHIKNSNSVLHQSQDHSLIMWAVAFYIIENVQTIHLEEEFVDSVLDVLINNLSEKMISTSMYIPLLKALERLIIKKCIPAKYVQRIITFAISKINLRNSLFSLPALQLLYTSMYIEYSESLEKVESTNGILQSNPEHLVQTIEKITAIFDRIKKGYPYEADIICNTLPCVLNDFFSPADILTKVIGEFLSPQQRHPMQMSKVVFQIFKFAIDQSQLSLLQDWVVLSLTNFTQSFSIGMGTWYLTCFFISASTNEWLRNMFPYVQRRIGRYEFEDRRILCIAGTDFYNNLQSDDQKKIFFDTLLKVKDQIDMPFNELLSCL